MDAVDSGSRSSGILSIMNREHIDRINTDTRYMPTNSMAASPATSLYSNNTQQPYSATWSASSHPSSGLISPPDSRRTSGDKNPLPLQTNNTHRQSLPSIHEALSSDPNRPGPYASPVSASLPPSHVPYTQSQVLPPPRTYAPTEQSSYQPLGPPQPRHASPPPPMQPAPCARTESNPPAFAEPRRPSLLHAASHPPPPANPYAASRYEAIREPEPRPAERPTNPYAQPSPHGHHSYPPTQQVQPGPPSQFDNQSRYPPRDERDPHAGWGKDKSPTGAQPHYQGVKRYLDVWDFENNLACVNVSSQELMKWSNHFNSIAQEQQRSHNPIPARMPDIGSVDNMLGHSAKIQNSLMRMKESLIQQQHAAASEHLRFGAHSTQMSADYDDESVYGDDRHLQGYGGSDSKKRRGRAAPPGRCHSCNRAETPEWRRGPDGARTLCNACGLHYAKLTRKNTMKQSQGSNGSSLRPKSAEDLSPRS